MSKTRRSIRFEGMDKEVEITKVAAVKADIDTLFSLERMKDGTYRLTYNAIQIPDITCIQGLTIVRTEEN